MAILGCGEGDEGQGGHQEVPAAEGGQGQQSGSRRPQDSLRQEARMVTIEEG